ncbi:MAG: magnesium/cobalt transporter CorA [Myxococcales bacterium]|nr:magnesium/cobalt transporter CorA [Myxococcales bacterium]
MLTKRNPPIGARPGTLAISADSPPPRIHVFDYGPEQIVERTVEDLAEIERYARTETATWIDVRGMGDEAALRRIGEVFGIHPLALEDAVNVPQPAKTELYDEHQIIIARTPLLENGELSVPQVCFLLGRHYLITFQDRYYGFFDPVRERIRAGIGPIRIAGADYLAYALIDILVDYYYPVLEGLSQELDDLEEVVLVDPEPNDLARMHHVRRSVATLRRVGWPQRETINDLCRSTSPFMGEDARTYLRDTHDHMSQIMGRVDFCREVVVGLMDMYLSNLSHRQNEIMKVLTLMASIFIPLTFIAGIYGMNFENMPELRSQFGYFAVLALMAAMAFLLVWYFRRQGWIGRSRRR